MRLAGLQGHEVLQDGGVFIGRLWRRTRAAEPLGDLGGGRVGSESGSEWWRESPTWRNEWGPTSVHDRVTMAVLRQPLSRAELAAAIGHKAITRSLRNALADLMTVGLIAYTLPEKPGSRHQQDRAVPGKRESP